MEYFLKEFKIWDYNDEETFDQERGEYGEEECEKIDQSEDSWETWGQWVNLFLYVFCDLS